jgi:hypothetical protein
MKVAFLVPSYIKIRPGGKNSAFTQKERINQTHLTLKTIREKCPDAHIIFIEGSDYDPKDFDFDTLIQPCDDPEAAAIINKSSGSQGESVMLMNTAYRTNLEQFDLVIKLSGRYRLTDKFSLDNFSLDKFTYYDHIIHGYETSLFAFPGKLKKDLIEILKLSLTYMVKNGVDSLEKSVRMFTHVGKVYATDVLGVTGMNGPTKRVIEY